MARASFHTLRPFGSTLVAVVSSEAVPGTPDPSPNLSHPSNPGQEKITDCAWVPKHFESSIARTHTEILSRCAVSVLPRSSGSTPTLQTGAQHFF